MKVTEIDYCKIDGPSMKIVGIRNVASLPAIEAEFGTTVARRYHNGWPRYCCVGPVRTIVVYIASSANPTYRRVLAVGDIIPKRLFSEMIKSMKAAANRLLRIRKEVAEEKAKVKTVRI